MCIIVLEPPYQTYSSVGQAGFHHRLSAHQPPHEFIVSMGLAQAHLNYKVIANVRDNQGPVLVGFLRFLETPCQ